jgi:hypothetical protein
MTESFNTSSVFDPRAAKKQEPLKRRTSPFGVVGLLALIALFSQRKNNKSDVTGTTEPQAGKMSQEKPTGLTIHTFMEAMREVCSGLERTGRRTGFHSSPGYDCLTVKDLRRILTDLFGRVPPSRASKADLIDMVTGEYAAFLSGLKVNDIQNILRLKGGVVPASQRKKGDIVRAAVHAGF